MPNLRAEAMFADPGGMARAASVALSPANVHAIVISARRSV
jgi:shikimate 5-dehydrogenase